MTKLEKPVTRETSKYIGSRNVIVTLAPAGSQSEALIGLRLKGKRTQYVCALSDRRQVKAIDDLARWTRKLKLAQTKISKLKWRVKYYDVKNSFAD